MFDSVPFEKLVKLLFILDKGDLSSVVENSKIFIDYNKHWAKQTHEVFRKTISKGTANDKYLKELLIKRIERLSQVKITSTNESSITPEEQAILRFVASCQYLQITFDGLQEQFLEIKKKHQLHDTFKDSCFVHTENVKILEISDILSSENTRKIWIKLSKSEHLNEEKQFSMEIPKQDLKPKELYFLYMIRCLELNGRFNKIYCHHLESILTAIKDEDASKLEINEINSSLEILSQYTVSPSVPGYCVILCSLKKRRGAINEAENVMETFLRLGYDVKKIDDPTLYKISSHLNEIEKIKYSYYDSLVVWIMAHGNGDYLVMSDNELYPRSEFITEYSLATAFRKKPKTFFMDTCEGGKFNPLKKEGGNLVETNAMPFENSKTRENITHVLIEMDRLIANSTLPNQYSYINIEAGSYYSNLVCKHMRESEDRNINSILEKVAKELQTKTSLFEGNTKQVSCYISTLQKKLIIPKYRAY